jgi:FAD:protein FMN transferase
MQCVPRRLAFFVLFCGLPTSRAETIRDARLKMGSRFEITVVTPDPEAGQQAIDAAYAEIDRLESLISEWRPDSEVSAVNRSAGVAPVKVSPEVFRFIRRSLKVSELTGGAFDVTWLSAGRLWDFKAEHPSLPDPRRIREALGGVGWHKVVLDEAHQTVFLTDPRTRIGFGGNGQGFAINRAAFVLKDHGIHDAVLDGSGDLLLLGHNEHGKPWDVGVGNPRNPGAIVARFSLTETAVTTSGDNEHYFIVDGKRYCHIIDPKTGWPADGVQSVTVFAPDAELADALDTGLFVMGPVEGIKLVNQLKGVQCLMIDRDGKLIPSANLKLEPPGAEPHS